MQRDKPIRRRLGPKDDRSNRRERPNDRHDRSDSDFPSNNELDGANNDEAMYDGFGGQGMHVGPFPSDIPPPPVLMPVPGAGWVDNLGNTVDYFPVLFLGSLSVILLAVLWDLLSLPRLKLQCRCCVSKVALLPLKLVVEMADLGLS